MFHKLRTRLTVLYAGLFGVALLGVTAAVHTAVAENAQRSVRDELSASGTVFDRLWALRAQQLEQGAAVLARDFGFREAVATGEAATVASALENLKARMGADVALVLSPDGRLTAASGPPLNSDVKGLLATLERDEAASGVMMMNGVPHQADAVPILAPTLAGWVVFAARLDEAEMTALEGLSAIPLEAAVVRGDQTVAEDGRALTLVKPLRSIDGNTDLALQLRYPIARAMAPYQALFQGVYAIGAFGLLLVVAGSWVIARGVTRPIAALDEAAERLGRGEAAIVQTGRSGDEVGRLAVRFNAMAGEIRHREARMARDAEALAVALHEAETANRLSSEFLANMSHEVRTPLNGVIGLSAVLATTPLNASQRELLGAVERSAKDLERMLLDVLDAARLQSGQVEVRRDPFVLSDVLRAAAEAWRPELTSKGLALSVQIASEMDLPVLGDSGRVRRVLDCLLGNALKFTAQGEVSVHGFRDPDGRSVMEVRDTGVGFEPSDAPRLFARFQQADGSSTRKHGGSGLGLPIARGLAELMGGTLNGQGAPGRGAVFRMTLPLQAVENEPELLRKAG